MATSHEKALRGKHKMQHPAQRPEAYKKDVETGWNKGKTMSMPQVKSVLRKVNKDLR